MIDYLKTYENLGGSAREEMKLSKVFGISERKKPHLSHFEFGSSLQIVWLAYRPYFIDLVTQNRPLALDQILPI